MSALEFCNRDPSHPGPFSMAAAMQWVGYHILPWEKQQAVMETSTSVWEGGTRRQNAAQGSQTVIANHTEGEGLPPSQMLSQASWLGGGGACTVREGTLITGL